jgi:hypothetical protein
LAGVERYAALQQISKEEAFEHILALGNFVFTNLAEGREFILKEGGKLRLIEWHLPEKKASPPTLRLLE